MGAELSTTVSQCLLRSTIDEMLRDKKIVKKLAEAIPSLSATSKANLNSLKTRLSESSSPNPKSLLDTPKLKPLLDVAAKDVGLSKAIQIEYRQWLVDWQAFLKSGYITSGTCEGFTSLLAEKYEFALLIETRRISDRLRWRFFTLFFYDLHLLVNDSGYQTTRGSEKLVQFLRSSSIKDEEQIIRGNIKRWIAIGLRYHTLSVSTGSSGCLFMLPESISDNLWEEYLPIKGPSHDEAVQLLQKAGIKGKCDDARASELGRTIRKGLLEPFKWHYSTVGDSSPTINARVIDTTAGSPMPQHGEQRTRKRKHAPDHTQPVRQAQDHSSGRPPQLNMAGIRTHTPQNIQWPGGEATRLQDAMDLLSTVAAHQQSALSSESQASTSTSIPAVNYQRNMTNSNSSNISSSPQQWVMSSQQTLASPSTHRYDMFALASFDMASLPFEAYIDPNGMPFPLPSSENRYDFGAIASNNVPPINNSSGLLSPFLPPNASVSDNYETI